MSNIVTCEYCHGTGSATCKACGGIGKVDCPDCDGSGKAYHICPECNEGQVPDPRAMDDDETMTCPTCHGEYKKEIGACKTCKGTGKVECQPCHGSGKVECQACNATGKFDVDKIVRAAIVSDWYDVETDRKVMKRAVSDEDITMLKSAAEQGHGGSCYVLGVLKGGNCIAYAEDGDSYFAKGAQAGDADCLYAHASVLLHKGLPERKEAIECLERSAEKGNVHALVDLTLHLLGKKDESGIASEDEKALQYCDRLSNLKAADGLSQHLVEKANAIGKCLPKIAKNDVAAMFEFGSICDTLYKTTGSKQDKTLAETYLASAAKKGNADAVRQLAEHNSKDNLSGSIEILDKAAKGGDKKAAERLQSIMEGCLSGIRGKGIAGDETSAKFEELKNCAKAGVVAVMKFLIASYKSGRIYEGPAPCDIPSFGLGDPKTMRTYDWESVAYWTEMAAKAGDGNSMLDYSLICRDGKGRDKDINAAFAYTCEGFLKGGLRRRALRLLAEFYRCTYFSMPDSQKVSELLTRSGSAGYLPAIVVMGVRYRKGKGVKKDLSEAKRLFEIAADNGSKDAKEELKNIPKSVKTGTKQICGITSKFIKDKDPLPAYVLSDYEKAKTGKLWSAKLEKQIKEKNKARNAKLKEPKKRWLFVALGIVGGVLGLHFLYVKRMFWFWTYWIVATLGVLQIEVEAFRNLLAYASPTVAKIPIFATAAVLILIGSICLMKKDGKGRTMKDFRKRKPVDLLDWANKIRQN